MSKEILTAHDLVADTEWIEEGKKVRVTGSRKLWETANYSRTGKTVRLGRLIPAYPPDHKWPLRADWLYVDPDTLAEIVDPEKD